jgi:DNA-binding transcriptional LysR family regulator
MVIKQLLYLVALAREAHFGRAAAACNISQPTLSAAIRGLEEELGVMIVERGHRYNGLTPEGYSVLDHAKRILADCDALKQELGALRGGLSGKLRIGVIPTALPVVALVTKPFYDRHPAVSITILSMTSNEIQRRLDDFEIEAGITYLDVEPIMRVRAMPLYREDYVFLTSATGSFADRAALTWREAADVPLILLTPDMQNRRIIDGVFQSIGRAARAEMETNSILNLATHVTSGPWSSIVPRPLIDMFGLPPGALALGLEEPNAARTVGLVIADREPASPLARSFFALAPSLNIEAALSETAELRKMAWRDPVM